MCNKSANRISRTEDADYKGGGKSQPRMDTGSDAATRGGQRDVIGEGSGEDKGT